MTCAWRAPAVALACAVAACAPRPTGEPIGTPPAPDAPTALVQPTAGSIAARERARVGDLRVLVARGVTEFRWRDGEGDHFEQGDADLRWCDGRGYAVSVSKLGERYGWVGSDERRWWQFSLKDEPTTLRWGTLGASAPGAASADADGGVDRRWRELASGTPSPLLLGLRPLLPRAGATPELRGGSLWVELEAQGALRVEAAFDPQSLAPRQVRLVAEGGAMLQSSFDGLLPVETVGIAQGAWPRIPRRVRVEASGVGRVETLALLLSIDSARADAEAADRPLLYDLDALRERFKPEEVTEVR